MSESLVMVAPGSDLWRESARRGDLWSALSGATHDFATGSRLRPFGRPSTYSVAFIQPAAIPGPELGEADVAHFSPAQLGVKSTKERFTFGAGRHAVIDVARVDGKQYTLYVVRKKFGVGKSLTKREAIALSDAIITYRDALAVRGWKLPDLLGRSVKKEEGDWVLTTMEGYIPGSNVEIVLRNRRVSLGHKFSVIRRIVGQVASYGHESPRQETELFGQKVTSLPHGVDLKLANLVTHANQEYLVDVFVPKHSTPLRTQSEAIRKLEPRDDAIDAICCTREGVVLRFLRLAEWACCNGDNALVERFRDKADTLLRDSSLHKCEKSMLRYQVEFGYPWLDEVYHDFAWKSAAIAT